tara:strand:- start:24 stop:263 length:240 start_codon:yes stop_codon:yes gene_type:complete
MKVKQKVNEDNQVYILIGEGLNNKLLIDIHNGSDYPKRIEVEGVDFPDTSDTDVEYRIDIEGLHYEFIETLKFNKGDKQ